MAANLKLSPVFCGSSCVGLVQYMSIRVAEKLSRSVLLPPDGSKREGQFPVGLAVMWRVRTCDLLGSVGVEGRRNGRAVGMVGIFKVSGSSVFVHVDTSFNQLLLVNSLSFV